MSKIKKAIDPNENKSYQIQSYITRLDLYLTNFKLCQSKIHEASSHKHLENVANLLSGFKEKFILLRDSYKTTTPTYSIFQILKINTLEAIVHTPFLTHLLNPQSNHNQGLLFVHTFINCVLNIPVDIKDLSISEIKDEKVTTKGNIDIFIRGKIGNKDYAIIIENKIYAGDQEKQLERYYLFLRENLMLDIDSINIVYLTPDGREPSIPYSIRRSLYSQLYARKNLVLKSYRNDIKTWLETCLTQLSETKIIESTIKQYLHTITKI